MKGGGRGWQKGGFGWEPSKVDGKKGGKTKGKGFGGECYNCGEKMHRSSECQKPNSSIEIGSVEDSREVQVGGVWAIAHVMAEFDQKDWNMVVRRGQKGKKTERQWRTSVRTQ